MSCSTPSEIGAITSPPVDIPIPISNLISVSGPDADGNVLITGAPGAVVGGATVQIANLDRGGLVFRFQNLLVATAWAQDAPAVVEVTADSTGAFQVEIKADVGDTLRIVQIVNGVKSPPLDLPVTGNSLQTGIAARDLQVSTTLGEAFLAGPQGSLGQVLRVRLDQLPGGVPESVVDLPEFSGVMRLVVNGEGDRIFTVSPTDGGLFDIGLGAPDEPVLTSVVVPLSLAIVPGKNLVAVGTGANPASVTLYDTTNREIACAIEIPPSESGSQPARIPELALASTLNGPQSNLVALIQFSDQSWMLGALRIHETRCSILETQFIPLDGFQEVGGITLMQGTVVWLSDAGGNRVLRVDMDSGQMQSIPVGRTPRGLALSEDSATLWVVNQDDNSLTAINTSDLTTRTRGGIGLAPTRIALDPEFSRALVLSTFDQSLVVVDLNF